MISIDPIISIDRPPNLHRSIDQLLILLVLLIPLILLICQALYKVVCYFQDPLNSDDDVSDADPSELFDSENVVVCQYDKVSLDSSLSNCTDQTELYRVISLHPLLSIQ